MANFADELRNASTPPRKPTKLEEFYKNYEKKKESVYHNTLSAFQSACRSAANRGKRSVLWLGWKEGYNPSAGYGISFGEFYNVELRMAAMKMAKEIKEMLNRDIAKMGFNRYTVRIDDHASAAYYGFSHHTYYFVIEARW